MTTPQQFLESFWHEKVAAHAETNVRLELVHKKYFGDPLLKHATDFMVRSTGRAAEFEDVSESAGSAIVVVREPLGAEATYRKRYHLAAFRGDWKITRIDRECIHCGGTGRSGRTACTECGGEGWYDPRKDAA